MRIAIVGAGPTGFFLTGSLLKKAGPDWRIDLFERTPFPFGLVRFGVAPDHPKIKSVTRGFSKSLADPRVHFWGGVEVAAHTSRDGLSIGDLLKNYHRVALTVGSQDDRKLGIPAEESRNSFSATRFVGWYNGHPDDLELEPDLSGSRASVVGAGNVAIDIVRLLISKPERLQVTDISDLALTKLKESQFQEVDVFVRRGPWDVAFTTPEVKELLDFEDVAFTFQPGLEDFQDPPPYADRTSTQNFAIFQELQERGKVMVRPRMTVNFHFLVSPREILVGKDGQVAEVELGHNRIEISETGSRIQDSGVRSKLPTDLFIRSVGYLGRPLKDVPFCNRSGIIPCDPEGRVLQPQSEQPISGLYASGWIRRGPSGVIGTNKKDAQEVADAMLSDLERGGVSDSEAFQEWLHRLRSQSLVDKDAWSYLDAREVALGEPLGRPRRKLLSAKEVLEELSRQEVPSAL